MAASKQVKILDVCRVKPSSDSVESATESSLPLTYFDTFWLKFHPVERIFSYELYGLTQSPFNSVLLPKLKSSLSLTLLHYHPLAGKIRWPPDHATKPAIFYKPNDTILVTIAESSNDFTSLSGNQIEATESRFYVPELLVSDSEAETIAIQITLFPNQGFSIGITSHHAVFDGKSIIMFLKSWAYLCKQSNSEKNQTLPPELTPYLDRSVIQNPEEELDMFYLNCWLKNKPKSLKPLQFTTDLSNFVRVTLELSREDIKKVRSKVISQLQDEDKIKSMHLSTFVLSYAYTLFCLIKVKKLEGETNCWFAFAADCRARLDPPLPETYIGNCIEMYSICMQAEDLVEDTEVTVLAEKLSEQMKILDESVRNVEAQKQLLETYLKEVEISEAGIMVGVAGSPRFGVYEINFGWGKPKKVEVTSIDQGGSISLAENKNGNGGIEIGLVLMKQEVEMFHALFVNGLQEDL